MTYQYKEFLLKQLTILSRNSGFNIEVDEEQSFIKKNTILPNTIYFLIKFLSNNIQEGAISQPVQILILSEQNSQQYARELAEKFVTTYHWYQETYVSSENTYGLVKHEYTHPVTLSNFNTVSYGKRSILYISGTLSIIESLIDVKNLMIDGFDNVKALGFDINYSMTPNTQQLKSQNISQSVKSASGLSIALVTPLVNNEFITKILNIMNGSGTGNENFSFSWLMGGISFSFNFKLISGHIGTAINGIPTIELGFSL